MNLDQELVERLRCPETKQPLNLITGESVSRIGALAALSLEAALIREDQKRAYPVRDGFPILLLSEAIELA